MTTLAGIYYALRAGDLRLALRIIYLRLRVAYFASKLAWRRWRYDG